MQITKQSPTKLVKCLPKIEIWKDVSCNTLKIVSSTAGHTNTGLCTIATEAGGNVASICNGFYSPDVKSAVEYICFL